MKKVFVELTMQDDFSDFLKASFLSEYKASEDGCKEYNKQNINNLKMLCIATYDDEKWVKIGYTVVNRNGNGGTHPWTKSASIEFRNFAQSEESCKERILTFLNQNYPNPSFAPIDNVVAQDKNLSNKKESNVQAKVEQATIIKELTVTSNVNSSTRQNSQENSETQENIKETICISDIKWNNEWNCKKSNNNTRIKRIGHYRERLG